MGSCNFYQTSANQLTLGYIPPSVDSEQIEDYRLHALTAEENDEDSADYIDDATIEEWLLESEEEFTQEQLQIAYAIVDTVNRYLDRNTFCINPLADIGNNGGLSLVSLELETGYYEGFRIVINDNLIDDRNGAFNGLAVYEEAKHYEQIPCGMTYADFLNCYQKALDACNFFLCEFAQYLPTWEDVHGGYVGGTSKLPPNNPHHKHHALYSYTFNYMLQDVRHEVGEHKLVS